MRAPEADKTTASGQMLNSRHRNSRMTAPEWAFVLGVLLLVGSALVPPWFAWRQRERLSMAKQDIATLQTAILRYHREYGTWPAESTPGDADIRYGVRRSNAGLMRVLRSELQQDEERAGLNPQRMIFIEVEPYREGLSGLNSRGEFLDPWGTPYQVVLDSNYDGAAQVEESAYGRLSGMGVLVWSYGPDRKSETPDDLLSWKP